MPASDALTFFRTEPYRYNCAQALCAAFNRNDLLEAMGNCGGGKAPDGVCGALYGALLIVPASRRTALKEAFRKETGAIYCLQLKKELRVPCVQCVSIAQRLAEREMA